MSELMWVAVPSGVQPASTALIRVLVVPRLGAGTISGYGMHDWPGVLTDARFILRTKTTSGTQQTGAAPRYRGGARSEIWQAFFGGEGGNIDGWTPRTTAPRGTVVHVERKYDDAARLVRS